MASILDTVLGPASHRAGRTSTRFGPRLAGRKDASGPSRLTEISGFGGNPGALRMLAYAPDSLAPGGGLVVVLHGCTQTAEGYDAHSGWSALADERGFALLYPEQQRGNNALGCFNWFQPADAARGLGEAKSIRDMIEVMVARHKLDRGKIFVVGLSAGGAMAAVMLAAYPEVFDAGAVIAGLPCGSAASVAQAFEAMERPSQRSDDALGDAVRATASYGGPWPRVSIWQGLADRTVAPANADLLVRQWLDVHGADGAPDADDAKGGRRRRVWRHEGREVVEVVTIAGMGHGTPLGGEPGERPGPYMLDVGVSSTREIAAFFGLDQTTAKRSRAQAAPERPTPRTESARASAAEPAGSRGSGARPSHEPSSGLARRDEGASSDRSAPSRALVVPKAPSGARSEERASSGPAEAGSSPTFDRHFVQKTIEKALKAAGLMR